MALKSKLQHYSSSSNIIERKSFKIFNRFADM
jgi:NADPH-dependent 7-cyano-7-deazaguanine reductase QueF-like protein